MFRFIKTSPNYDKINQEDFTYDKLPQFTSEQELMQHVVVGDNYYFGKNNYPSDKEKAIHYYQIAAAHGNVYAQLMCGYMNDYGDGIPQNPLKAIEYYKAAAKMDDPNATLNLANIFLLGRGVPIDLMRGIYWLEKSANLGNAIAASSLGRQYTLGEGVEKSLKNAEYWIKKAEDAGYVNCGTMTNLGLMYEQVGDYKKAFECFEKALKADPNDCNIQYLYGQYLFFGKGTIRDTKQAEVHVQWTVDHDPTDKDAYNLLTQIRHYNLNE